MDEDHQPRRAAAPPRAHVVNAPLRDILRLAAPASAQPRWLEPQFFNRPAAQVAADLIGKRLMRNRDGNITGSAIVETEAYVGPHDLACHAARGRTARTEVMFGPPGTLYVYLIYGLHWMLNVVTGEPGYPAAVLIRGVEGAVGPGRLTKVLDITRELNGRASSPVEGLWFEDAGVKVARARILRTARIGIDYAGPVWASKKLRFVLRPLGLKAAPARSPPVAHQAPRTRRRK